MRALGLGLVLLSAAAFAWGGGGGGGSSGGAETGSYSGTKTFLGGSLISNGPARLDGGVEVNGQAVVDGGISTQGALSSADALFPLIINDTSASGTWLRMQDGSSNASTFSPLIWARADGLGSSGAALQLIGEFASESGGLTAFVLNGRSATPGALGAASLLDVQNHGTSRFKIGPTGKLTIVNTDNTASTGNFTANTPSFKGKFAASASAITVTNSLIATTSNVVCTVQTNDGTLKSVAADPGSGSVVVTGNAAATGATEFGCVVFN